MSDSDDLTATFPPGEPKSTNPMLEQILSEVRAARETLARLDAKLGALDARVGRGFDDVRDELASTRATFRRGLDLEMDNVRERLEGHERRLRAIEDRERPT